jgi:hypothetical protein
MPCLSMRSRQKAVVFALCTVALLAETNNPGHSLPAEKWTESNNLDNFSQQLSLQRTMVSQFVFENCEPNTNLWRMQRISTQCTWVSSTPYFTVLTVNVATQVEPCFAHKKTSCMTHKPTNLEPRDRNTKNKMARWCVCNDVKAMNVKRWKELELNRKAWNGLLQKTKPHKGL